MLKLDFQNASQNTAPQFYSEIVRNVSFWRSAFSLTHKCAVEKRDTQNYDTYVEVDASLQYKNAGCEVHSMKLTNMPEHTTNVRNIAKRPSTVSVWYRDEIECCIIWGDNQKLQKLAQAYLTIGPFSGAWAIIFWVY